MVVVSCPATGCDYKTGDLSKEVVVSLWSIHVLEHLHIDVAQSNDEPIAASTSDNQESKKVQAVREDNDTKIQPPTGAQSPMANHAQKRKDFDTLPMGEKPASFIPGISKDTEKLLSDKGFGRACAVLGKFLILKKDKDDFCKWLVETCGEGTVKAKGQNACCDALKEWCAAHV